MVAAVEEVPTPKTDKESLHTGRPRSSRGEPVTGETTDFVGNLSALVDETPRSKSLYPGVAIPTRLAEFQLREKLGQGGFGCVYAGYDTVLQRDVAIKIPFGLHANKQAGINQYLHEARAIAALDHPHILPVYQAGTAPDVPLFIVMKWIDGMDLGRWATVHKPSHLRIASMVATVAEALAYAHARNIIHRDIKPANILVDQDDKPYLADFGLALTETDFHDGPVYIGTVPYMSPEQARGEGHRVDGRSDIFSLGIVLYQLLVGVRPFRGADRRETLLAIRSAQPEHPRRLNPSISKELARICMRALAKHKTERYPTAEEFALDLREYLRHEGRSATLLISADGIDADAITTSEVSSEQSRVQPTVVPKGLRPFETDDAEFFTRLLPGPYDRHGVPEKIRFWKAKIESRQPQQACSVGIIYGPSGCGKTSLFRAGLLPRLSSEIVAICVEATPHNTESLIIEAIRQALDIPADILKETQADNFQHELVALLAWIRRHSPKKVVLCIDQFEQWLLAHSATVEHAALTEALRQCDGAHLQSILLVRDDFWMGVTRLMQALEQEISELHNASCVDLFDQRHARNVLALFGQAYGKLPAEEEDFSNRENRFLDAAIDYLSVDGRVICVQLALLAEMMKHRPWNESSLLSRDGGAGIGVHFLEQIFDSESSPRRYRRHAEGTQKILRLLLPESGVRIKGSIRTEHELFEACGYTDLATFRELLRILDTELHLITPTDRRDDESMASHSLIGNLALQETGYQLTHDFLIAPVRRWLELRQLGTRAGQAQARLEEYADLYRARPSRQALPTFFEYWMIRTRLDPNAWSESQQRMMNAARSFYWKKTARGASIATVLLAFVLGGWKGLAEHQAQRLAVTDVEGILRATISGVIEQAESLPQADRRKHELLKSQLDRPDLTAMQRVRAALAITPVDPESRKVVWQGLEELAPADVVLIAKRMAVSSVVPIDEVRATWNSGEGNPFRQLSAACLYAHDDSLRPELCKDISRLVPYLLNENPMMVSHWMDGFGPVGEVLLDELVGSFEQVLEQSNTPIVNASNLIAHYAKDRPEVLAEMVAQSNETAFPLFLPALRQHPRGLEALRSALKERQQTTDDQFWVPNANGADWWNAPSKPAPGGENADGEPVGTAEKAADKPLDLKVVSSIAQEDVIGNAHFILCHAIDPRRLDPLVEHLSEEGFRVASLRPRGPQNAGVLMVLFKRDGRKSVWTTGSTNSELQSLHEEHKNKGFYAEDVAAYSLDNEKSFLFAAVWTDRPPLPMVVESDMYIHVHGPSHQTLGWQRFTDRGFVPRSNVLTMDADGVQHFTSVRWRLKEGVEYKDSWNGREDWYRRIRQWNPGTVLVQQRLGARPPEQPQRQLTSLCWNGIPVESQWIEYQSLDGHRKRSTELLEQGYRPIDIHVTEVAGWSALGYSSTWWRPLPNFELRSKRLRAQTRLIMAAHALGDSELALTELASRKNAELRAGVIDAFSRYQMPPGWLIDQLRASKDATARRGAALALALYQRHAQPAVLKEQIQVALAELAPSCTDPGLRSCLDAVCTSWKIEKIDWTKQSSPQEITTVRGDRMVVVEPPNPVWLGSPANEPGRDSHQEPQYAVQVKHRYAIAAQEITIEKYQQFDPQLKYPENYCPTRDCPMIEVSWFDAVKYCRWLSEQEWPEETELCYPPLDQIGPEMRLAPDYLERPGYRLPTEAEWEFASRGGYTESRHFGFAPHLLNQYAWTAQNSDFQCHAVGTRLPNDYGLFDMLGNAMEWCQDHHANGRWPVMSVLPDQASQLETIQAQDRMVSRGGAVLFQPLDARSAHRNDHPADQHRVYLSFRIARTIP